MLLTINMIGMSSNLNQVDDTPKSELNFENVIFKMQVCQQKMFIITVTYLALFVIYTFCTKVVKYKFFELPIHKICILTSTAIRAEMLKLVDKVYRRMSTRKVTAALSMVKRTNW